MNRLDWIYLSILECKKMVMDMAIPIFEAGDYLQPTTYRHTFTHCGLRGYIEGARINSQLPFFQPCFLHTDLFITQQWIMCVTCDWASCNASVCVVDSWFMQPHLAQVWLLRLCGRVGLHTCGVWVWWHTQHKPAATTHTQERELWQHVTPARPCTVLPVNCYQLCLCPVCQRSPTKPLRQRVVGSTATARKHNPLDYFLLASVNHRCM